MKNKSIVIISIILIALAVITICVYNRNTSDKSSVVDFINSDNTEEYEDPNEYSSNVPKEVEESDAWTEFTSSVYYNEDQEYIFRITDDRVVSDLYYGDYYIYIEYVFEELTIDVYNAKTMDIIIRYE